MTNKPSDSAGETIAANQHRTNGATLLVVDDDPMVRKIVARGLARLDPAEVIEVADGAAAQAVLLEKHVDVVVTDVLMPQMSGLELMKWAQQHCPGPLWIVLSGLETFDAAVDALQLGAFDYLAKPPEVQRVRVAVRNALDQIELVRERKRLYDALEQRNAQLAEKVDQLEKACGMLEEQAGIIQADLDRAEIIQRALLPQEPPAIDGWCMQTLYRSGSSVGGDFYDVIVLNRDYLGLVIADASGHGVAAAMLSVLFKLRLSFFDRDANLLMPNQVLENLNRRLIATVSAPGTFITAAYVMVNRHTGELRMASAGHTPCIRSTPGGEVQLLERTGPALGLDADASYTERACQLEAGDRLLMYTDGVLGAGETFSCDDLAGTLCSGVDRADVPGNLYRAATRDAAGERDDITVILVERGQGASRFDDTPAREERQAVQAPSTHPELRQAVRDNHAFISIAGAATWTCGQAFLETASELLAHCDQLTIDLGECSYLDSTCLGTLHEIVMSQPDAVSLQRLPDNIRESFEELSMDEVLKHANPAAVPLPDNMVPLRPVNSDPAGQGARILSAHETLASLSPQNREVFQGVVNSLRADLERKE
ncbi:SpoIIE family protein phosphatase [Haliea sp. E17]|uniref:SpoIIE family protein phosphatase n=1 Tax=Haliea sp. E17 TaxID=3401576 RepID=UPI003AAA5BD1